MEKLIVRKRGYVVVILCLLAVSIMPIYLYGTRVLTLMGVAVATSFIADFLCIKMSAQKQWRKGDYSFAVTGLIIALLLPATAPPWVGAVAAAIAIMIAKHPFGGNGFNIFNPAAVGISFCAICWPEYVLRYPAPYATLNVVDDSLILFSETPARILSVGGTPKIDYFDVLLGEFAGPIGATCMIVLAACLIFLVLMRVVDLRVFMSTLLVVGIFAVLAPRVSTGEWSSLIYEGSSGVLIFGLIFMASDPVSLPNTRSGRVAFGIILGICVVAFRRFGMIVDLEFVYALLIANIFAIPTDRYAHVVGAKLKLLVYKWREKKSDTTVIAPENDEVKINA